MTVLRRAHTRRPGSAGTAVAAGIRFFFRPVRSTAAGRPIAGGQRSGGGGKEAGEPSVGGGGRNQPNKGIGEIPRQPSHPQQQEALHPQISRDQCQVPSETHAMAGRGGGRGLGAKEAPDSGQSQKRTRPGGESEGKPLKSDVHKSKTTNKAGTGRMEAKEGTKGTKNLGLGPHQHEIKAQVHMPKSKEQEGPQLAVYEKGNPDNQGSEGPEAEIEDFSLDGDDSQMEDIIIPPEKRACTVESPPGHLPPQGSQMGIQPGPEWLLLLKSLPNREELDTVLNMKFERQESKMVDTIRGETRPIQEAIQGLSTKIDTLESELARSLKRVETLEKRSEGHQRSIVDLALQVLDLENRNRRENVRIRGIPEKIQAEALEKVIVPILNYYMDRQEDVALLMDRYHRVPGRRLRGIDRPRDVLVKLHYFTDREAIIRGTWKKDPYKLEGEKIIVLQDVARKTLAMRRTLKPILEEAKQKGIIYRWGFPFSLNLRRNDKFFVLKDHRQLDELFVFMDIQPLVIQDWIQVLLGSGD